MQELDLAPFSESGRIDECQGTMMATSSRKRELVVVGDLIITGKKGFSDGVLPAWCPGRRYPGTRGQAPGQSGEESSGHGPRQVQ